MRLKPRWLNVKAPAPLQASEVDRIGRSSGVHVTCGTIENNGSRHIHIIYIVFFLYLIAY